MRRLKKQVLGILEDPAFEARAAELLRLPGRQVVNPLFSFFMHPEARVRWHAVTAMGMVVSHLADAHMESARVVVRRMIWQLNDESGGIGWGCPEAMGEIIASHDRLASEYACILISYLNPTQNYLEHPVLQRGALWGFGRAAYTCQEAASASGHLITPFLASNDPYHRGLGAWAAGAMTDFGLAASLSALTGDKQTLEFYNGSTLTIRSVGEMAKEALEYHTSH